MTCAGNELPPLRVDKPPPPVGVLFPLEVGDVLIRKRRRAGGKRAGPSRRIPVITSEGSAGKSNDLIDVGQEL